jgi:hypothetical protein
LLNPEAAPLITEPAEQVALLFCDIPQEKEVLAVCVELPIPAFDCGVLAEPVELTREVFPPHGVAVIVTDAPESLAVLLLGAKVIVPEGLPAPDMLGVRVN